MVPLVVEMSGTSPVTVTVSTTEAGASWKSRTTVSLRLRLKPSRFTELKPGNDTVTVYGPVGRLSSA